MSQHQGEVQELSSDDEELDQVPEAAGDAFDGANDFQDLSGDLSASKSNNDLNMLSQGQSQEDSLNMGLLNHAHYPNTEGPNEQKLLESELNSEYNYDQGVFDQSQHATLYNGGLEPTTRTMVDGGSLGTLDFTNIALDQNFMNSLALK